VTDPGFDRSGSCRPDEAPAGARARTALRADGFYQYSLVEAVRVGCQAPTGRRGTVNDYYITAVWRLLI
jgi:hypothetical protein